LNDNDEDKQPSELLRRLQSTKDTTKELNNNADLDNEQLKERLRFQGGPGALDINSRKRASDESDESAGAPKRLSKLQEKNKMLASLLAGPSRPLNSSSIGSLSQLPTVRQMPDIPNQVKHLEQQQQQQLQQQQASTPNNTIPNTNSKGGGMNNNNTVTKNNNLKTGGQRMGRQPSLARQQSMQGAGGKNLKMNESVYLAQMQSHQQQQMVMSRVLTTSASSQSSFDSSDGGQQFVTSSPSITLAAASSSSAIPSDSVIDPELNDILDNLFDEGSYNEDPMMNLLQNNNPGANHTMSSNQQRQQQEELAQINKIQQSLMECEDEANFSGSPPAYQMHVAISAAQQQSRLQATFSQPPPGYNQRTIRLPQMSVTSNSSNNNALNNNASSNNLVTNSNAAAIAQATNSQKLPSPAQLERYRMQQQVILEQKQRLLQQQQNQQIVVTGAPDQLCKLMSRIKGLTDGNKFISFRRVQHGNAEHRLADEQQRRAECDTDKSRQNGA
jgi:hypothetical protein